MSKVVPVRQFRSQLAELLNADLHVPLDRDVALYDLGAARVAAMPELVGRGRNAST